MYIYLYTYMYIYIYVHTYFTHKYSCLHICHSAKSRSVYTYTHIYIHVFTYINTHIYMNTHNVFLCEHTLSVSTRRSLKMRQLRWIRDLRPVKNVQSALRDMKAHSLTVAARMSFSRALAQKIEGSFVEYAGLFCRVRSVSTRVVPHGGALIDSGCPCVSCGVCLSLGLLRRRSRALL